MKKLATKKKLTNNRRGVATFHQQHPVSGHLSAACSNGTHFTCFVLKCSCACHGKVASHG